MKRLRKIFLTELTAMAVVCLMLSGCGGKKPDTASPEPEPKPLESVAYAENWKRSSEVGDESDKWSVVSCGEIPFYLPAEQTIGSNYCVCRDQKYYALLETLDARELRNKKIDVCSYILFFYDMEQGEAGHFEIERSVLPGQDDLQLCGFDVAEEHFLFFFAQWKDGSIERFYRVKTDLAGKVSETTDLLELSDSCREEFSGKAVVSDCRVDAGGNIYVIWENEEILLMDPEGRMLGTVKDPDERHLYAYLAKYPDGTPVFQDKGEPIYFFTVTEKGRTTVGQQENPIEVCTASIDGRLFYVSSVGGLYEWNVNEGTVNYIYGAQQFQMADCSMLGVTGLGEVIMGGYEEAGQVFAFYTLSQSRKQEPKEVVIQALRWDTAYLKSCADEYARKHPGISFQIDCPDDKDAAWNRLQGELAAGKGPDMLLLSGEQLRILQEKGVLADLSEVLREENKKSVFPGILAYGTIENRLYGVAYAATVSGYFVSEEVWPDSRWSLEDILELIREREESGQPIEEFSPNGNFNAYRMFSDLLLIHVEGSKYLDLQNRTCSLNSEEVVELMKLCQAYGKKVAVNTEQTTEDGIEALREGRVLALRCDGDLKSFSSKWASLGDSYHVVGYPAESGQGYLLDCYTGCVAVNQDADNREVIDDFINYLMSYSAQKQYGMDWVRRDVMENNVMEQVPVYDLRDPDKLLGYEALFMMGRNRATPLGSRADGTSYLKEYLEVMEKAYPVSPDALNIRNIMSEELAYYFIDESKSAQKVADVIQNRVKLYLNE